MTVASVPFSLIYLMRFAIGEADGNKGTYEVTEVRAIHVVALCVSSLWRGASHPWRSQNWKESEGSHDDS